MAREMKRLAHELMHALRAVRGDVMRAGRHHERRLLDRLIVPAGVDRRLAGKDDQRDARPRRHRQRGHELGDAGPAGDGGNADLAGRAVIAHGHGAGAMLVPDGERVHAVEVLHGRGPMHVAVAHQGEMGVDAFGREGMGQRFVDRQVAHCGSYATCRAATSRR